MIRPFSALFLCVLPLLAVEPDAKRILKGVQDHYNRARTLRVDFQESFTAPGQAKRTESGDLLLRKPGRMRWVYHQPAGKLFVSDGKDVYFYVPADKRVEKTKLSESEDLRAPLAFLLGKLDFDKEFQNFQLEQMGGDTAIRAIPKGDKLPYKHVDFLVTPEHQIRKLRVTGQDGSLLEFVLENEHLDILADDKTFRFQMPPGAELVDYTKGGTN